MGKCLQPPIADHLLGRGQCRPITGCCLGRRRCRPITGFCLGRKRCRPITGCCLGRRRCRPITGCCLGRRRCRPIIVAALAAGGAVRSRVAALAAGSAVRSRVASSCHSYLGRVVLPVNYDMICWRDMCACANLEHVRLRVCDAYRVARYCSPRCQRVDWGRHKRTSASSWLVSHSEASGYRSGHWTGCRLKNGCFPTIL